MEKEMHYRYTSTNTERYLLSYKWYNALFVDIKSIRLTYWLYYKHALNIS